MCHTREMKTKLVRIDIVTYEKLRKAAFKQNSKIGRIVAELAKGL